MPASIGTNTSHVCFLHAAQGSRSGARITTGGRITHG